LHYLVEPVRFVVLQDQAHRNTFRYEIEFVAVGEVTPPDKPWNKTAVGTAIKVGSDLLDTVNGAVSTIGVVAAGVQAWTGTLAEIVVQVEQPIRNLQQIGQVLAQAKNDIGAIARFPQTYVRGACSLVDQITLTVTQGFGDLSIFEQEHSADTVAPVVISMALLQDNLATITASLQQQPRVAGAAQGPQPYQIHSLVAGEDLTSIARDRLGDAARWSEIAALNALQPPYVSTAGLPGTAMPGAVLLLPTDAAPSTQEVAISGDDNQDQKLYGIDLRLDNGDFFPTASGIAGWDDFALIRGLDNVEAALLRRLQTPLGANRVFPGLGIPLQIGEPRSGNSGWILAHVTEQVERDDRVRTVASPSIQDLGDGVGIDLTAVLVDGRKVPVGTAVGA
jgi:hypothetical protein